MADLSVTLEGLSVSRVFTVTATDVAKFVDLSGDDYEAHTDAEFMARSSFGQRIAHGALLVGYMSAVGTMAIRAAQERGNTDVPVSLGYDRLRFVGPVFFEEQVTASYVIKAVDEERRRSTADVVISKADGSTAAVAEHIMKWLHTDATKV
jgi:3-hydroxybutyryl-CoA dehydratase